MNCNRCLYKQFGVFFTDHSALYKLVTQNKTLIDCHFIASWISRVWFLHMQSCTNIKRIPGHKETDPDVQFTNNYPDNWAFVAALIIIACSD